MALGSVLCLLGCSGLFAPSAPVELSDAWRVSSQDDEWRVHTSDSARLERDDWSALRLELEGQGCRHLDVGHYTDGYARKVLGFFDCNGTPIEVEDVQGDRSQLALRSASPQAVALADEPVWTDDEVLDFPQAIAAAETCDAFDDVRLLSDGSLQSPVGGPFVTLNKGTWLLEDGILRITSRYVDEGGSLQGAEVVEQSCGGARFWSGDRKRGWLCNDRYESCSGGNAAWLLVVGGKAQRELVGRALAVESRFGTDVPVVPSDGAAPDRLTVAYRSEYAGEASYVVALLEQDLGVRAHLREDPQAEAPVVVQLGSDGRIVAP
jgi:hypothetical protein